MSILRTLLPRARAWRIAFETHMDELIQGLSAFTDDIRAFLDLLWLDLLPSDTRQLDLWEEQFGLPDTGLSEADRRARLDAAWKALGGQDPRYIQDTLQAAGFDVYVHEWWVPGSEPALGVSGCAVPRPPGAVIGGSGYVASSVMEAGEPQAEAGEPFAEAGNSIVGTVEGYLLVNPLITTVANLTSRCGEPLMRCGEATAVCGAFENFVDTPVVYPLPVDPAKWPYFLYIGGAVYGTQAGIPAIRREEFEALCLRICPTQQWLGIMVTYI